MRHGAATINWVARSSLFDGRYGRLFRNLPPLEPGDDDLARLAAAMVSDHDEDNPAIPAGYTYFGQFIDHDITFDATSSLQRTSDPDHLRDFRTPRLDLDSLYGGGPQVDPHLYDRDRPGCLLTGIGGDLPRNQQGIALTADPRNDENVIVAQVHAAFIRLHNAIVQRLSPAAADADQAFAQAQRTVCWLYQWVVLHDFLPRLVGRDLMHEIMPDRSASPGEDRFHLRLFNWRNQPFMPIEFSAAAYRIGHAMVRDTYVLNDRSGQVPLFTPTTDNAAARDLRGSRPLTPEWWLDWELFLPLNPSRPPQLSRRLDGMLTAALSWLPGLTPGSLALRNLQRGRSLGLPSGQDVARAMGVHPLSPQRSDPLWAYVLREAAELGHGERMGPVGGRIVAEVLAGLVSADPFAYPNIDPLWTPGPPLLPDATARFDLADLMRLAGSGSSRPVAPDPDGRPHVDLGPSYQEVLDRAPAGAQPGSGSCTHSISVTRSDRG